VDKIHFAWDKKGVLILRSHECPMDVLMEELMGDLDDLIVDGEKFTFEHLFNIYL
jgi:hypothetical protein